MSVLTIMERLVPAYEWLKNYQREDFSRDFSAGLVVAVMLVPQGMAYALLAGLPPIFGLYASTVPAVVYALFGTSRHMPVGPPALMALLTFTSVSALSEPGSKEYVALALLLALMAGALQLALGLLRLGFITNFISHPVLLGFVYASAILIALGQAKYLLGITVGSDNAVATALEIGRRIGEASPATVAIGAASILALTVFAKATPRFPGPLVVTVAGVAVVYLLGLDARGVGIVGEVPRGLPGFSLPSLDPEDVRNLAPAALAVAFVGFVESISVAKAVAAQEKYKIDSNQELKALGLANIAAAFCSGFPVAGSFSRTAVQYQAGARTQLASLVTALAIVLTLLFFTPLFYYLPNAALAAIIIVAVYRLIDIKAARRIFRVRRADGYALLVTFALTLFVGVVQGIIFGSLFALLAFVRRSAYPNISVMGYVEDEQAFLGTDRFPGARIHPEVLIVRFDAALYFANVPYLEEWLLKAVADKPELKWIVLDCRGVNGIDATAIGGLEDLVTGYRSRGVSILFSHVKLELRERLRKAEWESKFGGGLLHSTTREALDVIGTSKRGTDDISEK